MCKGIDILKYTRSILLLHSHEMYEICNLCKLAQVSYSVHFT